MTERITNETIRARLHNVNRRLAKTDVVWVTQGRNGAVAIDRGRRSDGAILSTITVGTKREVADFLHAAMVALDDARVEGSSDNPPVSVWVTS
jgi:hypothetical protein